MSERGSFHILVVEDDRVSQLVLKAIFEKNAYTRYSFFTDGKDVLNWFQSEPDNPPDLILMDIRIDGPYDGVELARRIESLSDTPVLFLTGNTNPSYFNAATRLAHYAGFLGKPYHEQEIIDHIRRFSDTERAERVNQEAESLLGLIFASAEVGICVTDSQGRFVKLNRAYSRIYGYSEYELLGNDFSLLLPPDAREEGRRLYHAFLTGEIKMMPSEWQALNKQGELLDIFVTAARLVMDDGECFQITTVSDMTQQKQHLRRLEQTLKDREPCCEKCITA